MVIETIAGTILGFLGTALTTYSNYKMAKIQSEDSKHQRAHELDMVNAQSEAMIKEAEASIKVAQVTTKGQVDLTEANAFLESQKQGNKSSMPTGWIDKLYSQTGWVKYITIPVGTLLLFVFGIVEVVQTGMRSFLTLYSVAMATFVTYQSWQILEQRGVHALSIDQAYQMWTDATSQMILLAVTLITWWFGDRRMAKHLMHLKERQ